MVCPQALATLGESNAPSVGGSWFTVLGTGFGKDPKEVTVAIRVGGTAAEVAPSLQSLKWHVLPFDSLQSSDTRTHTHTRARTHTHTNENTYIHTYIH